MKSDALDTRKSGVLEYAKSISITMMNTSISRVFEIISRYKESPAWRYCGMAEGFILLRNRLADKTLYIGLAGSFSSGKSSLINAIIGRDILPNDVLQGTTTIPCIIQHSSKDYIRIVYTDGTSKSFSPPEKNTAQLFRKLLLSENAKYIAVGLVSCNLPDDIALVDTPGTESLNEEHEGITLFALEALCNAMCLVITYDKPLPMSMVSFIKSHKLDSRMQDSAFIISKPDLFRNIDKDLPRMLNHNAVKLAKSFGVNQPLVIPVPAVGLETSIRLRNMRTDSLRELFGFFRKRRNRLIRTGILSLCRRLCDELKTTLKRYETSQIEGEYQQSSYEFREQAEAQLRNFFRDAEIDASFVYSVLDEAAQNISVSIYRCPDTLTLRQYVYSLSIAPAIQEIYSRVGTALKNIAESSGEKLREISRQYQEVYSSVGVSGQAKGFAAENTEAFVSALESDFGEEFRNAFADAAYSAGSKIFAVFSRRARLSAKLEEHKNSANDEIIRVIHTFRKMAYFAVSTRLKKAVNRLKMKCILSVEGMISSDKDKFTAINESRQKEFWTSSQTVRDMHEVIRELEAFIDGRASSAKQTSDSLVRSDDVTDDLDNFIHDKGDKTWLLM